MKPAALLKRHGWGALSRWDHVFGPVRKSKRQRWCEGFDRWQAEKEGRPVPSGLPFPTGEEHESYRPGGLLDGPLPALRRDPDDLCWNCFAPIAPDMAGLLCPFCTLERIEAAKVGEWVSARPSQLRPPQKRKALRLRKAPRPRPHGASRGRTRHAA